MTRKNSLLLIGIGNGLKTEKQQRFFVPPILIEFPGFVACKGKETRIILKKFYQARNSLADLFYHKTYKEVLMEKTVRVATSAEKQKLDDQSGSRASRSSLKS